MPYKLNHPLFLCILIALSSCALTKNKTGNKGTSYKTKNTLEYENYFFKANLAKLEKNFNKALEYYNKALNLKPNDPTAYYESGRILSSQKKYKQALELFKKAYNLNQDNMYIGIEYGKSLLINRNLDKSLKIYKKLIEKNPRNIELHFSVFKLHSIKKNYKKAIKSIEEMEEIIGVNSRTTMEKERLFLKINDIKGAENTIKKLIKQNPKKEKYLIMLSKLYISNDMEEKAVNIFKDILKKDSSKSYPYLFLYQYYKEKKDKEKKDETLVKILGLKKINIETKIKILFDEYMDEIKQQKKITFNPKFESFCKKLIENHPKEVNGYMLLADYYKKSKKDKQAIQYYKKSIEIDTANPKLWEQLILTELKINDTLNIIKHSDRAIELFINNPLFYYTKSVALQFQKKYLEAFTSLEIGIEFADKQIGLELQMKISMADCQYQNKKISQAFIIYEDILQQDSNNSYVLNNYSYYLSLQKKNLEKAKRLSKKAIELEPNEYNYYDTYAWVLYQKKEYKKAYIWIKKAIEKGGGNSDIILEHKGDILYHLNKTEEAIKYWKEAKSKGDGSDKLNSKIKDKTFYE